MHLIPIHKHKFAHKSIPQTPGIHKKTLTACPQHINNTIVKDEQRKPPPPSSTPLHIQQMYRIFFSRLPILSKIISRLLWAQNIRWKRRWLGPGRGGPSYGRNPTVTLRSKGGSWIKLAPLKPRRDRAVVLPETAARRLREMWRNIFSVAEFRVNFCFREERWKGERSCASLLAHWLPLQTLSWGGYYTFQAN